ncbi:MAG: hypothetical protein Q9172_007095 [Xanthocarpia lactea]
MKRKEFSEPLHGRRKLRSQLKDPLVHPPMSKHRFEDLQVYPATTKWNRADAESRTGYSKGASSATDPRLVIRSSRFPTDEDRQWYSAATRSKQTRVICWLENPDFYAKNKSNLTLDDVCFVCKIDLKTKPSDRTSYPFSTWKQSAAHGCQNCDHIYRSVRLLAETYSLEVNDFHIATLNVHYDQHDISRRCQKIQVGVFWVHAANDMSEHLEFERYSKASPSASIEKPPKRLLEPTVQDIFVTAQKLVRTCNNSHKCLLSSPNFLPTRLLDIQGSPCEFVKVVETFNLPVGTATRYIALSYCWGNNNPIRLLRCTLQTMSNRIDRVTLPKLFQDVVQLAQLLDIRYIWIDALCIVQDDKQDWQRESLLMGKTYRNADLVVGATSCNNSSESLAARSFKSIPISIEDKSSTFCAASFSTMGGNITWPLHSRGWTYQEMILANRFFDFDSNGLQLHCHQGILHADDVMNEVSRDGPLNAIPADRNIPSYRQGRGTDFRQPWSFRYFWSQFLNQDQNTTTTDSGIFRAADGKEIGIPEAWQEVVMMYTNRRLTYVSDLLPALSGIASEYLNKAVAGEEYFAGLWRNSFVQNLTWTANHDVVSSDTYQAPSWSWASIKGSVDYNYTVRKGHSGMISLGEQRTSFVEALCEIQGANPLGEATSGFAILEGPIFECVLRVEYSKWCIQAPKAGRWKTVPFRPDVAIQVVQYSDDRGETRYSAQRLVERAGNVPVTEDCECEVSVLHLFDLARTEGLYLVLGSTRSTSSEYQRLGLLELSSLDVYGRVDSEPHCSTATVKQVKVI